MIVSSFGAVQALSPPGNSWSSPSSLSLYSATNATYAALYRTQPSVRTCVDFLARNIAQLSVHAFRRVSETDRVRLFDHPTALTLKRPNPSTTRYRCFESLMQDLGIYFNAYWLKIRTPERLGLLRLPPEEVTIAGRLLPSTYTWAPAGARPQDFNSSEIVHFGGYDPLNPLGGLSPLETLRRILAEEAAAGEYQENLWSNAARIQGVIQRPKDAPPWTPEQRSDFREQWQDAHSGAPNTAKTAVLEDGMEWKEASFSPKAAEFNAARKLRREEVAAEYHIPLPMVGILEHATFSNIREQHKNLYQDALGPWTVMIEEELERQLLVEADDDDNVYLEFNIQEKLKGSFEEQSASIRSLVGGPIMTRNEGRARLNLPAMSEEGANRLITPLNVDDGGDPEAEGIPDAAAWTTTIQAFWVRQARRVEKDEPEQRARLFDLRRWNQELAADLTPLYVAAGCGEFEAVRRSRRSAAAINDDTLQLLARQRDAFSPNRVPPDPI